jgi:hypothetical protein
LTVPGLELFNTKRISYIQFENPNVYFIEQSEPKGIAVLLCSAGIHFFTLVSWGLGSNWVNSALRALIGLLCKPRLIMLIEKLAE